MRFLDFFSGIGGFRLGMEMAGHTCVGHCEIDKFADRSYRAMHNVKESEWYADDITRVEPEELPEADCYCFGFPCQAFSIAGKRRGFEDTRGTLFFEVMRLARERKPRLLSPKTSEVSSAMRGDKHSESLYPQWMNWGTMSNGRCLTANILGFPRIGKECSLLDILEKQVDEKYFLSDATMEYLIRNDWKPSREFRHLQQRATKESQRGGED